MIFFECVSSSKIDWQLQYIAGFRKLKVAIAAHPVEVLITKSQIIVYNIMIFYAITSVLIAFFSNNALITSISGWVYFGIGPTIFLYFKFKE